MDIQSLFNIFVLQSGFGASESTIELAIRLLFMVWGFILLILGLRRIEPLLLLPLGISMILANAPGLHLVRYDCHTFSGSLPHTIEGLKGLVNVINVDNTVRICTPESTALLAWIYHLFVRTEIGPILIFFGIGALSDFRPMLSYPIASIIGAAAQLGIIIVAAIAFAIGFPVNEAMAIGVVGGADGPTTIYTATNIAPYLVGPLTIAVYSYIALIPIIQPPIARLLIPKRYRAVKMPPPREVSAKEIIAFWMLMIVIIAFLVPHALPLVIALAIGNIIRESGITEVVARYGKTVPESLLDIATIITMLGVGATLSYDFLSQFVRTTTAEAYIGFLIKAFLVLGLGLVAFVVSTVGGIALAWFLYIITKGKVNPIIGCAGVSAVPISARVAQREASRVDPSVYILYHALGPNVAGVIGTAIVAGFYIGFVKQFILP